MQQFHTVNTSLSRQIMEAEMEADGIDVEVRSEIATVGVMQSSTIEQLLLANCI